MTILGMIISTIGIAVIGISAVILLPKVLFISNEELEELEELPLKSSSTRLSEGSGPNLNVVIADIKKLTEYKEHYIKKRRGEKGKGKIALYLIAFGSILQIVGLLLMTIPSIITK